MPWVDHELCSGCGMCVDECPGGAIAMIDDVAEIDMSGCIRCGVCHDLCPVDAVKHDRLKIPEIVQTNVEKTKKSMAACEEHFGSSEAAQKSLKRSMNHFENARMAAEKTLEELGKLMH